MNKIGAYSIILILFFSNCGAIKTKRLLNSGSVKQENFKVEIPFEMRLGLIILKVKISGNYYDFMLDTGAPNVIDRTLAEKLQLDYVIKRKVGDSQGESSKLDFVLMDAIGIGELDFEKTSAVAADLRGTPELACLDVDGFIGSNLMRKAIWKIDYQTSTITITNSRKSLSIPESAYRIPFTTVTAGTPLLTLNIDSTEYKNIKMDTGSNGCLSLKLGSYKSILSKNPAIESTCSYGSSSGGLYGRAKSDTTYYLKIPEFSMGNLTIKDYVTEFSANKSKLLGTEFFKNYDVIIDWWSGELILINQTPVDYSMLSNFGFSYFLEGEQLIISELYKNNSLLKIGDQIIQMGDSKFTENVSENYCQIIEDRLKNDNENELSITVLRDGKELAFTLTRMNQF